MHATTSSFVTKMHGNLIKNPGRGLYWNRGVYDHFHFYNNHVIANTTASVRTEGLFGFASGTDWSTIHIRDNIFELRGTERPLFRSDAAQAATVKNNELSGVSDAAVYENTETDSVTGPLEPLFFRLVPVHKRSRIVARP